MSCVIPAYETGPIRPPSEAQSLLIRLTRNCPWNRCTFCTLYKGRRFSPRLTDEIISDIDQLKRCVDMIKDGHKQLLPGTDLSYEAWAMTEHWINSGMRNVFLQDANSPVLKPEKLVQVLRHLRRQFPDISRITSYARSQTISRISPENMQCVADAGLNRIHIGMETACDRLLELVKKGTTKQQHIEAGVRVKQAGIELSEYYMPGLGGLQYAECSAFETADALNLINPDFIRIRTAVVLESSELAADYKNGVLTRSSDVDSVRELLMMIRNLEGISSMVRSDHIINLLPEVRGKLPEDRRKMTDVIETFLSLPEDEQIIFRTGRRTGIMALLKGLESDNKRRLVLDLIEKNGINSSNIDSVCDRLLQRYI